MPVGCGRNWTATARSHTDGSVTLEPQADPYLVEAALAFHRQQNSQVERLRSGGEKWIAGISAILGIVGVIGLSTEMPDAQRLATAAKWAVAAVGLVGILAGVTAVYRAYQAAYGWPVTRAVGTDDELIEWYASSEDIGGRLATRLRQAAVLAGFSVIALTTALGLAALLPSAVPELTNVRVTLNDMSTVCGNLLTSDRHGELLIHKTDDGQAEFVPIAKVISVSVTKNC
jgi:hypothetical protein